MKSLYMILFMALAVVHVFAVKSEDELNPRGWMLRLANFTKALLMPGLVGLYVMFANKPDALLIAALSAGWLGDIALMIKGTQKETNVLFMVGLLCFLLGHILYCVLFYGQSMSLFQDNLLYVILFLPYLLYCLILYSNIFQPGTSKLLRTGAIVYSLGLTAMSFAALSVLLLRPSLAASLLFLGSLVFVSSDSVLALKTIGGKKEMPERYILGSYITAQLLIVLGNLL